jgi:rare lipoprotein A
LSGRHSTDEPFDLTSTAEMSAVPSEAEDLLEDADAPMDVTPEPPAADEQPRRVFGRRRTRYLVAGAATIGTLAIATAGVAAVHSATTSAAEPPTTVHVTTPTGAPSPSTSPTPDVRRYLDGDRASRSMQVRPTPSPTPSKTSGSSAGSGSGGAPVTDGKTCKASFYGEGQNTASGERFNPNALTAAHKTLPFGTHVRVTNTKNGETVTVRINDRGPFVAGRCLDLSTAAFKQIASTGAGVITVRYQVV